MGERSPSEDAFVLHEYAFSDRPSGELIEPLVRAAAGDLRRVAGWLPPDVARDALPRGCVRRRKTALFMAAPLDSRGASLVRLAAERSPADGVWSADHV